MPLPPLPDAMPDDLLGGEAARWFVSRPWGGTLLDHGLTAVTAHFGSQRELGAWVPADPLTGRHTDFFLQVSGRVERMRDWERMVSVYEELELVRERHADDRFHRALRRFHPVLARSIESPATPENVGAAWYGQ